MESEREDLHFLHVLWYFDEVTFSVLHYEELTDARNSKEQYQHKSNYYNYIAHTELSNDLLHVIGNSYILIRIQQ